MLELVETAHVFQESLKEGKETLSYIDFEFEGNISGIEHLQDVLQAIRSHHCIRFRHESYQTGKAKIYNVKPYLIKEYQGRWYVIGEVSSINEFRTFGLDRITEIEILTKTFVPQENLNLQERFHDVVGLTYSEGKVQKVVLSVKNSQLPYLKSVPLHSSQRVIVENKDHALLELFLKPNYEFVQRIFMQMETVKVVEPEWLVKDVKKRIEKMRKLY